MFALILSLLAATPSAEPRVVGDEHVSFSVPAGFEPFPGFKPTATKLYAFGKNVGTPDAMVLAIDRLEGPTTAGAPSRSCGALMNSMDRTVGKPITEPWQGQELHGLRLVLTQMFGEVVVYCVDVPLEPNAALSLMVSGKPSNEALIHETFQSALSSLGPPVRESPVPMLVGLLGVALLVAVGFGAWRGIRALRRR
jgi:hypothetical protein